jgi:hypothetical protein
LPPASRAQYHPHQPPVGHFIFPLSGVKQTSLSSPAALLDIFEIGYRGDFLANARQQETRCADPFVRAVTVGVMFATATAAERLTLGATRHHGRHDCASDRDSDWLHWSAVYNSIVL